MRGITCLLAQQDFNFPFNFITVDILDGAYPYSFNPASFTNKEGGGEAASFPGFIDSAIAIKQYFNTVF